MSDAPAPVLDAALLARLERLTLGARRTFRGSGHGQRRARAAGVSTEFRDHRPYAAGDDLRHLDWTLYARLDRLYLKRFHDEQDLTLHVVLDASASMAFGAPPKIDLARRVAAALAHVAIGGGDRCALHVLHAQDAGPVAREPVPVRGRAGLRRLLAELAAVHAGGVVELAPALDAVGRRLRSPGILAVVSDFLADGTAEALERLGARRHQVHAIEILAPEEADPGRDAGVRGDVRLVDAESGAELAVSVSPRLRALYREALEAHHARLDRAARALDAPVVRALSSDDLGAAVLARMQAAGIVR